MDGVWRMDGGGWVVDHAFYLLNFYTVSDRQFSTLATAHPHRNNNNIIKVIPRVYVEGFKEGCLPH